MAKNAISLKATPVLPKTLATVTVAPSGLFRVSTHDIGEPYFGKHQGNRFDDPNPDPAARYGTSYFGESLDVALAETLLHDRMPGKDGYFHIERSVIESRYLIRFQGSPLVLADMTGTQLKRMGGHAGLSGTASKRIPQRWSSAVYGHQDMVDGFQYKSRHLNDSMAYVVFDRAANKLDMASAKLLSAEPEFGPAATRLYITSTRPRPRGP